MSETAILVEGLGKRYTLGGPQQKEIQYGNRSLKEALENVVAAPFRAARKRARGTADRIHGERTIWALKDVGFEVKCGEVVGIIGRNGAGKSTLLKILSRITGPTTGRVEIQGSVGSLLEVGTGFHPDLTGRENIYLNGAILGLSKTDIARQFDEIVAFAEVEEFIDVAVRHYSSGMYMRLAFAVAAQLTSEILFVDEVLAVGDIGFQRKCLGRMDAMAKAGRTVIFVSHNVGAIRQLCEKALLLDAGKVVSYGEAGEVVELFERQMLTNPDPSMAPGCLFFAEPDLDQDFQITRIELLDDLGQPKRDVVTWDAVRFRIFFRSNKLVENGSVVLQLNETQGTSLLLCSTQPDSNYPLRILPGLQFVECYFDRWPFAEGTYQLSAALAIPHMRWLGVRATCSLGVTGRRVFGPGTLIQTISRAATVIPHSWSHGRADSEIGMDEQFSSAAIRD